MTALLPLVKSEYEPPGNPGTAARPSLTDPDAAGGWLSNGQPEGAQAPDPLIADVAMPAAFPLVCFTLPSAHVHSYGPVVGFAVVPPALLHVPTAPLSVAGLLPLCHPWVSVVAAGPAASVTVIPRHPGPFHSCWDCHCFLDYLPPTDGPQGTPSKRTTTPAGDHFVRKQAGE